MESLNDLFEKIKIDCEKSQILSDMYLLKYIDLYGHIKVNVDCKNEGDIRCLVNDYNSLSYPTVTCGIMTYNEERCIKRCLDSVINEFDEVIVLDSLSKDNTVNIIKEQFPMVKVYFEPWIDDFSFHRNEIINHSQSEWIFFIDADNYYSNDNDMKIKRIAKLINFLKIDCVISPTIYEHDGTVTDDTRKMFPLKNNIFFSGRVHEEPLYYDGRLPFNVSADIHVYHDGYDHKVVNQFEKNQRNIKLTELMIKSEPTNPKWIYFYAKESFLVNNDVNLTKNMLLKAIELYKTSLNDRYYPETINMMCSILLKMGNYRELKNYIDLLEKVAPSCSDIDYYRASLLSLDLNIKMKKIFDNLQLNLNNHDEKTFSFINSSNDHIKYLMIKLAICFGDFDSIYSIYKDIKSEEIKKEFQIYINKFMLRCNKLSNKNI